MKKNRQVLKQRDGSTVSSPMKQAEPSLLFQNLPALPPYFLFTQHSLSTFEQCPLKFKKRYIENLKWDSSLDEKSKQQLQDGRKFHLMAYRYFSGIDIGRDDGSEQFDEIMSWMETLKNQFMIDESKVYLPEYKLRMASGLLRLEANFDLLEVKKDGTITIWDWKTHSKDSIKSTEILKKRLSESLQTFVYMFVLKEQSHLVLGRDIECEKISMRYWQPHAPHIIAEIFYDESRHQEVKKQFASKIQEILQYDYSSLENGHKTGHCKRCEFNWFCNREKVDFSGADDDIEAASSFDWDDMTEIF